MKIHIYLIFSSYILHIFIKQFQILSGKGGEIFINVRRKRIKIAIFPTKFKTLTHFTKLGCEYVLWGFRCPNNNIFPNCFNWTYALQLHLCNNWCHTIKINLYKWHFYMDNYVANVWSGFNGNPTCIFVQETKEKTESTAFKNWMNSSQFSWYKDLFYQDIQ